MGQNHNPRRKIINDPVYGFITITGDLIFELIEHPYFQRLRRIKQLGMSHMVYPGAHHTRFNHALGAMHLMSLAISSLREKGADITPEEAEGALVAILLHDIGHGPFSHSLEFSIVRGVDHEAISRLLMEKLNSEFDGRLDTGIAIFQNRYPKKFLHRLVSSQLDMDRLDYLMRDSFYTGVSEGVIGNQRIIKMLNVADDRLVIEEKGIYSIEKFIVARRLMYWQVYLHKTVVSAERLLIGVLQRAKELALGGDKLFASPALAEFLYRDVTHADFTDKDCPLLHTYCSLDDFDVMGAIKVWTEHPDPVLSDLCRRLVDRKLMRVVLGKEPFSESRIDEAKQRAVDYLNKNGIDMRHLPYYFRVDELVNSAYDNESDQIEILTKSGELLDLAAASDNQSLLAQTQSVRKYALYGPK